MDDDNEDGAFDVGEMKAICNKVCNNVLANQPFIHAKVTLWTTTIIENVLKEIAAANGEAAKTPGKTKFKYVVHAQVQQRTGSAMVSACAGYWDKTTDGYACCKWESPEIQVLVSVFGLSI